MVSDSRSRSRSPAENGGPDGARADNPEDPGSVGKQSRSRSHSRSRSRDSRGKRDRSDSGSTRRSRSPRKSSRSPSPRKSSRSPRNSRSRSPRKSSRSPRKSSRSPRNSRSRSPRKPSRSPRKSSRSPRNSRSRSPRKSSGSPRKSSRSRSPRNSSRSRSPRKSSRSPRRYSRSPRRSSRRSRSHSPSSRSGYTFEDHDRDEGFRLHVADLDANARKRDLEKLFGRFGPLREIWMARSIPCFAFVVYRHREDAEEAQRKTDGTEICGRRARITIARPRTRGRSSRRSFDSSMRCYQCGERGHFSRDCPDNKWGYKRPPSPRRRDSRY